MSGSTRVSVLGLLVSAACGFPRPSNVGGIGGHVHGLWDGTDGVVLRLQAEGIDALLAVPTNGIFTFPDPLAEGTRYTVVVAANPPQHVCVVEAGGSGTFADADVTTISIGCTGPSMTLALSGPWGWVFDPTLDTQTFSGSIAMQDVALTISGSTLASATIAGSVATLGQQTAPIALPLGSTTVPIALTAAGGLAKNYQLVFERGASLLDQVVYGKASNTGAGDAFRRYAGSKYAVRVQQRHRSEWRSEQRQCSLGGCSLCVRASRNDVDSTGIYQGVKCRQKRPIRFLGSTIWRYTGSRCTRRSQQCHWDQR